MPNQTYVKLQAEIARLQGAADQLRDEEVAGVVGRIKEAIAAYGLTPEDLFGRGFVKGPRRASKEVKAVSVKYADGKGGVWVGRGPRPLWLREALSAGRSLDEFSVSASLPTQPSASTQPVVKTSANARPSYRDPATGKLWNGFGRQPEWLKKAIAAGQTLESLRA